VIGGVCGSAGFGVGGVIGSFGMVVKCRPTEYVPCFVASMYPPAEPGALGLGPRRPGAKRKDSRYRVVIEIPNSIIAR
jgi:hypothetical protein